MRGLFVLGLPRCRTAWMAKFLSTDERPCQHEPSKFLHSRDDLVALISDPLASVSDSLMTLRWRDILEHSYNPRIVVVHRPMHEVVESFGRLGVHKPPMSTLRAIERAMNDLMRAAPVLTVPFKALDNADLCAAIYRYATARKMPKGHYQRWAGVNVQASVADVLKEATATQEEMRAIYPEAFAAEMETA